jgi:hypothetical protein
VVIHSKNIGAAAGIAVRINNANPITAVIEYFCILNLLIKFPVLDMEKCAFNNPATSRFTFRTADVYWAELMMTAGRPNKGRGRL